MSTGAGFDSGGRSTSAPPGLFQDSIFAFHPPIPFSDNSFGFHNPSRPFSAFPVEEEQEEEELEHHLDTAADLLRDRVERYLVDSPTPDSPRARRGSGVYSPLPQRMARRVLDEHGEEELPLPPRSLSQGVELPGKAWENSPDALKAKPFPRERLVPIEQQPLPSKTPTKITCRYFAQGYCAKGSRCNYLHEDAKKTQKRPNIIGELLANENASFDQFQGHIFELCKDQHGCRFLQKVLEDRDIKKTEIVFQEIVDNMVNLMTDPFGNYLCQKLLEFCTNEQRLHIIQKVAPYLVEISKNMHGTRAVQKMVDHLSSPDQVLCLKNALSQSVVTLIQDLNGNHVIQRCLNRFSPDDKQFIYDAVTTGTNCVAVATHRHGCCVLQRCIDFASPQQKFQLIQEISNHALALVQDPFGNYVVQYVLDLHISEVVPGLCVQLVGSVVQLSSQKFSSNVIEKILLVAPPEMKQVMVQEIVETDQLVHLLQDPYANYVIQTALQVAEPVQHHALVSQIKPHLALLRNTPYGKRIQNKISKEAGRVGPSRQNQPMKPAAK